MKKHQLIVLTHNQEEFQRKLLARHLPDLEIFVPKSEEEIEADIGKADILLANPLIACHWINKAKNVVWFQSTFAGIDAMNVPDVRKDYVLTNVKGAYGQVMAEYVMAYILCFEKEILEHHARQKQGHWNQKTFTTLEGKVLCLLGTGSIGKEIAERARQFGMRVLGYRKEKGKVDFFDEIFTGLQMKEFLSQGDFIVSVLPNTVETNDIINAETIACMKPSAVFMNIGRGNAVNEQDLAQALKEKKIAKAVLDVFKTEPLPAESPFWSMENVYITPHVSGAIVSDEVFKIFEENYKRFLAGKELLHLIDLQKGY